jgi:hypothetical protein
MTRKVMTSAEEAGGPKIFEKIFFILLNENEQTTTLFFPEMQKCKKSTHPVMLQI